MIPYWRIQNSWGDDWGDDGFILVQIVDGYGVCSVNKSVYWVEADDYTR